MKKIKTLGIIGGLGPETTARFYMEVVFACSRITGQRPSVLISNVAIPLEIEKILITKAKNERKILPFLINSAKQLEKGGADFIVIPCNTVHIFIEEIRKSVNVPILSIIEETSNFLKNKNINEIGLLATTSTIKNRLFDKDLIKNSIRIKIPNKSNQLKMGNIIHNLVDNKSTQEDKKEFLRIIIELRINNILLACTDLQLLKPKIKNVKKFDTMDILAKSVVRKLLE